MSTTPNPAQFVPIRGSDRPGDIAELVTPAELEERQRSAEQAPGFDFGPALPGISSAPAGATTPQLTRRPGTSALIAIGGVLLAALLIGLSVLTQRAEPATGISSPVAATPSMAATMAPVVAATDEPASYLDAAMVAFFDP